MITLKIKWYNCVYVICDAKSLDKKIYFSSDKILNGSMNYPSNYALFKEFIVQVYACQFT